MVMVIEVTKKGSSSASTWKRRKIKTKLAQGKGKIDRAILFCQSRHHRGCDIGFRIDSRTVKRGDLTVNAVI